MDTFTKPPEPLQRNSVWGIKFVFQRFRSRPPISHERGEGDSHDLRGMAAKVGGRLARATLRQDNGYLTKPPGPLQSETLFGELCVCVCACCMRVLAFPYKSEPVHVNVNLSVGTLYMLHEIMRVP